MRDANGRDRHHRRRAATLFNEAGFLDAERRKGQPADGRHRGQPEGHAQGSRQGGSHRLGRGCTWEELYRQFQREGTAMRFFCQKTATGGGRGAGAGEDDRAACDASLSRRRRVDGQLELRRAVPWRRRRRHRPAPSRSLRRGMGRMGPLRPRCRESRHPEYAPLGDGNRDRGTDRSSRRSAKRSTCDRSGRSCTWKV